VKGQSGNKSGRPKDLANFGELLMKEFYETVIASMGGKTVKRSQREIVAQQMVKNAILKGQASHMGLLLKFIEAHEISERFPEFLSASRSHRKRTGRRGDSAVASGNPQMR
jgi:hypothetical protein